MCPSSIGTSLPSGDSGVQALPSCGFHIFNVQLPSVYACLHQTGKMGKSLENYAWKVLVNQGWILQITSTPPHCL